jgi:hypothetical protein
MRRLSEPIKSKTERAKMPRQKDNERSFADPLLAQGTKHTRQMFICSDE